MRTPCGPPLKLHTGIYYIAVLSHIVSTLCHVWVHRFLAQHKLVFKSQMGKNVEGDMIRFQVSVHCTLAQGNSYKCTHPSSDKSAFLYSPPPPPSPSFSFFLLLFPLTSPPSPPPQEEPEEFIAAQWYKAATNASNPVEQLKAYQKAIQTLKVEEMPYCALCKYGRWLSCSFFSSLHSFSPTSSLPSSLSLLPSPLFPLSSSSPLLFLPSPLPPSPFPPPSVPLTQLAEGGVSVRVW